MKAFVLHNSSCVERDEIVQELVKKTKATVFQSYLLSDGKAGCRQSHIAVAKLAKSLYPLDKYIIFEDDCVLADDWETCLTGLEFADVIYLGYNDKCEHTTFGTHALVLSPKARDVIIDYAEKHKEDVINKGAFDFILSLLCRKYGLLTCMPKMQDRERYCHQKRGLVSQITGKIRD